MITYGDLKVVREKYGYKKIKGSILLQDILNSKDGNNFKTSESDVLKITNAVRLK